MELPLGRPPIRSGASNKVPDAANVGDRNTATSENSNVPETAVATDDTAYASPGLIRLPSPLRQSACHHYLAASGGVDPLPRVLPLSLTTRRDQDGADRVAPLQLDPLHKLA